MNFIYTPEQYFSCEFSWQIDPLGHASSDLQVNSLQNREPFFALAQTTLFKFNDVIQS